MTAQTERRVGVERQYFDQLASGHFVIQSCSSCNLHLFPPREICAHCGADALNWVTPSGYGTIYSHTIVMRKPEAGGTYNIVLVDLDEGVRIMSSVVDIESEQIHVGMKVYAHIENTENTPRIVFTEVAK